MINSYDYIFDKKGNIYTVRGKTQTGVVATLTYYKSQQRLTREKKACSYKKLNINPLEHSISEFEIPYSKITKVVPFSSRNQRILDLQSPFSSICQRIVQNCQADVYLFGSRLLQLEKTTSDFDYIIDTTERIEEITQYIAMFSEVSNLSNSRISKRASRYRLDSPGIEHETAIWLAKNCTSYINVNGQEIGIFFTNTKYSCPFIPSCVNNLAKHNFSGYFIHTAESCYMPRILKVKNEFEEIRVITTSWLLFNATQWQGYVQLTNLFHLSDNYYFFSNNHSQISFE
ncbi:hypothetical protein [Halodesulfovibrio sp.]|uniref:hypothetical protein n=1 Tax=Halodesulfovibrio sp. TaxID=1912772 RepID=UPI0025C5110C|nr:hypothetical protein [Halodesulfovibrio sp.]